MLNYDYLLVGIILDAIKYIYGFRYGILKDGDIRELQAIHYHLN